MYVYFYNIFFRIFYYFNIIHYEIGKYSESCIPRHELPSHCCKHMLYLNHKVEKDVEHKHLPLSYFKRIFF